MLVSVLTSVLLNQLIYQDTFVNHNNINNNSTDGKRPDGKTLVPW